MGIFAKESMSSDRWETLPRHPCNLASTCLPLPSASVPLPLTRTVHRTLLCCTLPPHDVAVPLLCVSNPAVTTWLISPLVRVQQPSQRGSAGHRPLSGEKRAAHGYEVGSEHLGGFRLRNLPHLHILLIKASAELSHGG